MPPPSLVHQVPELLAKPMDPIIQVKRIEDVYEKGELG
jgi:hypothetical protein